MGEVLVDHGYQYFSFETGSGSAWGTEASSPVLLHHPTAKYDVKQQRMVKRNRRLIGLAQSAHSQNVGKSLAGSIDLPFMGHVDSGTTIALARSMFEWAFGDGSTVTIETGDRPSCTVYNIVRDGGNTQISSRKDAGLRVNKFVLKGSEDGFVEMSMELIGKSTAAFSSTPNALPNDRQELTEALFIDSICTLGGSNLPISAFELSVDFGLKPRRLTSTAAAGLTTGGGITNLPAAGGVVAELTLTPLKTANTWDGYQRLQATTELSCVLSVQGLHGGSGASGDYTRLSLSMARCALENADEVFGSDDIASQPLKFAVLKPSSSAVMIVPTWSEV